MFDYNIEIEASEEPLSKQEEALVVHQLCDIWAKGEQALRPGRDRKKDIVKAYNAQHLRKPDKDRSDAYLTLVYNAIEIGHARLESSLLPTEEEIFTITGETEDDNELCDMMSEYLKSLIKDNDGEEVISDAIKEALIGGEAVIRVSMRKDVSYVTQMQQAPLIDETGQPIIDPVTQQPMPEPAVDETGQPIIDPATGQMIPSGPKPTKVEQIDFYGCMFETVHPDDFIIFPVTGDKKRACMAQRVWRYYDELLAAESSGFYQNVSEIPPPAKNNSTYDTTGRVGDGHKQGMCLKEFWLPRIMVNGRVYRNMIATVVDDKYLIRFENNRLDGGIRPFIYVPLIKDYTIEGGMQNSGHGICHRAFEMQRVSNMTINQVIDESRSKLFGMYKYKPSDKAFNPATFTFKPNGLIATDDPNNCLIPLNQPLQHLSFGIQELEYFQNQFETTTGIPKFLHGVQDTNSNDTATAKRLAAEGADVRFRKLGKTLNRLLEDVLKVTYTITRQVAMEDPTLLLDIAKRTQVDRVQQFDTMTGQMTTVQLPDEILIQKVQGLPTLKSVDIKVVGFENTLRKQEFAMAIERFFTGIANIGMAIAQNPQFFMRYKMDDAADRYAQSLGVGNFLRSDAEMMAVMQNQAPQLPGPAGPPAGPPQF